jgi:hypothetical protein
MHCLNTNPFKRPTVLRGLIHHLVPSEHWRNSDKTTNDVGIK